MDLPRRFFPASPLTHTRQPIAVNDEALNDQLIPWGAIDDEALNDQSMTLVARRSAGPGPRKGPGALLRPTGRSFGALLRTTGPGRSFGDRGAPSGHACRAGPSHA